MRDQRLSCRRLCVKRAWPMQQASAMGSHDVKELALGCRIHLWRQGTSQRID
jgi:hypothetical protein